jgi:ATP-dependent helicase HrpA
MGRYTAPPCRPIPSKPACAATSTGCAASATGCAASSCGERRGGGRKAHWPADRGLGGARARRAAERAGARVSGRPAGVTHREEIRRAIEAHPVVIVCGETGSGKTTQLPKICLEAGRGVAGVIGHTQPRRIAARAVAARIAEELKVPLGELVGYKLRFQDRTGPKGSSS